MRTAGKFAIVALIALAVTVTPGGGAALDVLFTVLTIAFFVAISFFGYRLYRENRATLEGLPQSQRLVLYGSVGAAFLTFVATPRLFGLGGLGVLLWLALLGACSYGVFWTYMQSRPY